MDEDFIWVDEAATRVGLTKNRIYKLIYDEAHPCASESIGRKYKSRKIPNTLYAIWLELRIKQKVAEAKKNMKLARIAQAALDKFRKDKGL